MATLEEYLPANLRDPNTVITRIAAGLSGAGVHRVEAGGQTFVLKISAQDEPLDSWRHKRSIQQLAANAGLAPRVIHVDEARRAVVSDFAVDRSFVAFYGEPRTHDAAIAQLGRTIRRVHALPVPADAEAKDPRDFIALIWSGLVGFALPHVIRDAIELVLAERAPVPERALVLSHNDVNPTNLVYDGVNVLLLDWETAAPNDPFYDLAAASVFFRMDESVCAKLLAAYDGVPAAKLTARFGYNRRLAAVLCGTMFLHLARGSGHVGALADATLDSAPSLADFYQRVRTGSLTVATAEGQWLFGLALVKTCIEPAGA
jgi:thiamine kinase-like enzyme